MQLYGSAINFVAILYHEIFERYSRKTKKKRLSFMYRISAHYSLKTNHSRSYTINFCEALHGYVWSGNSS